MRRLLVLAVLGCASGGGGNAGTTNSRPDRVVLTDERGHVYRTTNNGITAQEQLVPGTREQAVQALVGVYEAIGVKVNTADSKAGRVGSENFTPMSRLGGQPIASYVDCGPDEIGRPRAATYGLLLTTMSNVEPASAGYVRVNTLLTATGRPREVSGASIACQSTGGLEKRVHLMLAERMAR